MLRIQAQIIEKDSTVTRLAFEKAVQHYHASMAPEPGLYRGSEYVVYAQNLKEGHPYFDKDHMRNGSLLYNGILYRDVPLAYDLVKGLVVTYAPMNAFKIILINELIDSFTIENHIFIRLKDSLDPSVPRPGYYEQIYKGRVCIMKKEKKSILEQAGNTSVEKIIDHSVSYYLVKGNTWYPVNNKRSLLHTLGDRNKEARKFMRRNDLDMTGDKENTLLKIAAWYDGSNQ
ncbi:hypothetical protein Q4E93_09095 [Flavitalea sp. BT771]|uniref:hypothetical protein n=1 Tax=Flavitalea sp. BT771 TaxID=3063329 RepID=UPI0026E225CE|nr:hypothetical protein [Flavitalea sp. BT771]MDO6430743.1 hypothetical protein [Flavitalea sp. BT771]MDV6219117.1 hypothetical protein [Flavitalea sp. BT771]